MSTFDTCIRWLVVDDNKEDANEIALALSDLGGRPTVVNDLKSAERALVKTVFDACVIDCNFVGSTKTGEDLIPIIRKHNRSLPIVMTSSSADPLLPSRVVDAGADIFVNKMGDFRSYKIALKSAYAQARSFRARYTRDALKKCADTQLFLEPKTATKIEAACKSSNGNVLVLGAAGTGKTTVATLIAEALVKTNCDDRNVQFLDAAVIKSFELEQRLFGAGENGDLGCLVTFAGGAIVIENVESMERSLQCRIRSFVTTPASASEANVNRPRLVFTATQGTDERLINGFLETIADREILLPGLADLNLVSSACVASALERCLTLESQAMGIGSLRIDSMDDLTTKIVSRAWPTNFRGLRKVMRSAIESAFDEGRTRVLQDDFDAALGASKHHRSFQGLPSDFLELLNDDEGKELLSLIATGVNYRGAQHLLRRVIIRMAKKKNCDNRSKMSRALGISRGGLYDSAKRAGSAM